MPSSTAPPHIVIVTPELWGLTRENGGISTSVFHLARLLRDRGDRVTILAGIAKDAALSEPWARRYRAAGIKVRLAIAAHRRGRIASSHTLDFPFRAIAEAVADELPEHADVAIFQDWSAIGYETLRRAKASQSAERPLSVTVLRGSSAWVRGSESPANDDNVSNEALACAERFVVEHSRYVVAPSRSYLRTLVEQGTRPPPGDRTRVLRHPWLPLGTRRELPSSDKSLRRLVYFGLLKTQKGLDLFLDALVELHQGSDCLKDLDEVLFVGREEVHRRGSIERIAAELDGYGVPCRFLTDLDSWQASELLADMASDSLVVVPSLRENFPNAVIEVSLVRGLNALYSDLDGVREVLGDCARDQLFAPDAGSLATALRARLHAGPRGPDELMSYDWEGANDGWLAFRDELVSGVGSSHTTSARNAVLR